MIFYVRWIKMLAAVSLSMATRRSPTPMINADPLRQIDSTSALRSIPACSNTQIVSTSSRRAKTNPCSPGSNELRFLNRSKLREEFPQEFKNAIAMMLSMFAMF